ncbi:MAG: hypothetical protein JWR09_591 [Mucilaginibacter sp.]|nr:hypothetical protein [Mucilaginibacter sp.]
MQPNTSAYCMSQPTKAVYLFTVKIAMKIKKYLAYSALSIFIIYFSFSAYKIYIELNYDFKGKVQNVSYESGKYRPTITVNNQQFDLEWARWIGDEENVAVGDSVVKHKGSQWMTVVKKKLTPLPQVCHLWSAFRQHLFKVVLCY